MIEKNVISKGPQKRDATCLRVQNDIRIPAGTILRQESGRPGIFKCPVEGGELTVEVQPGFQPPTYFKRVVAA